MNWIGPSWPYGRAVLGRRGSAREVGLVLSILHFAGERGTYDHAVLVCGVVRGHSSVRPGENGGDDFIYGTAEARLRRPTQIFGLCTRVPQQELAFLLEASAGCLEGTLLLLGQASSGLLQ